MPEHRITLNAQSHLDPAGRFEVDAITAGEGNGWMFTETALQESIPLWEGVPCFVDHAGWFNSRSVRDLGGEFSNPRWVAEEKAIRLELVTIGPAGRLVDELGRQIIAGSADSAAPGEKPRVRGVGFSADVLFTAKGKEVEKILRVYELCLVVNPARGGAFVRALNSIYGDNPMPEPNETQSNIEVVIHPIRLQNCAYLLESGLNAANLPAAMTEHVRKAFTSRIFEPAELTAAIEDARQLVSVLAGPGQIQGPRVHAMFNTEDQLQAAVDDLLGAPRNKGAEPLQVARLQGIKELYLMLTGDRELWGGYNAQHVQLATTANFTGLVKNALNKVIANRWEQLGRAGYDWWQRVTLQEHFESLNQVTGILVGTIGSLPVVAEGAEYTELKVGDSPETASFTKYGGYVPLTLELIDRDETRKLRQYPIELANSGLRRISGLVSSVFTDNAGIGPTMADGGALFNAAAVTTAGGHGNLLTTALSAAQWETVSLAIYNQPMLIANETGSYGGGAKMAINPRYLLVPRALELTARKILYPSWENAANIHSENLQQGRQGDVVTVPEWTDATDWAAVVDPLLVPGIIVCERFGIMPQVFIASDELSPAVFTNDEHRLKVRHFVAILVQDFRPLHKSNV